MISKLAISMLLASHHISPTTAFMQSNTVENILMIKKETDLNMFPCDFLDNDRPKKREIRDRLKNWDNEGGREFHRFLKSKVDEVKKLSKIEDYEGLWSLTYEAAYIPDWIEGATPENYVLSGHTYFMEYAIKSYFQLCLKSKQFHKIIEKALDPIESKRTAVLSELSDYTIPNFFGYPTRVSVEVSIGEMAVRYLKKFHKNSLPTGLVDAIELLVGKKESGRTQYALETDYEKAIAIDEIKNTLIDLKKQGKLHWSVYKYTLEDEDNWYFGMGPEYVLVQEDSNSVREWRKWYDVYQERKVASIAKFANINKLLELEALSSKEKEAILNHVITLPGSFQLMDFDKLASLSEYTKLPLKAESIQNISELLEYRLKKLLQEKEEHLQTKEDLIEHGYKLLYTMKSYYHSLYYAGFLATCHHQHCIVEGARHIPRGTALFNIDQAMHSFGKYRETTAYFHSYSQAFSAIENTLSNSCLKNSNNFKSVYHLSEFYASLYFINNFEQIANTAYDSVPTFNLETDVLKNVICSPENLYQFEQEYLNLPKKYKIHLKPWLKELYKISKQIST